MTHYRAQPEDDAALIVLCAVRDGQFGKSALNEVIDLWVSGQIGRTDSIPGAVARGEVVEALKRYGDKLARVIHDAYSLLQQGREGEARAKLAGVVFARRGGK
jgi:hypothetical protein